MRGGELLNEKEEKSFAYVRMFVNRDVDLFLLLDDRTFRFGEDERFDFDIIQLKQTLAHTIDFWRRRKNQLIKPINSIEFVTIQVIQVLEIDPIRGRKDDEW